jgi:hypothetical protein
LYLTEEFPILPQQAIMAAEVMKVALDLVQFLRRQLLVPNLLEELHMTLILEQARMYFKESLFLLGAMQYFLFNGMNPMLAPLT